jgi:proteasome lid subunit RPN8/RPN11
MLHINEREVEAMRAHAEAGYPEEVCGLLLGTVHGPGQRHVREARPAANRNRDRARDRYEIDPVDYLRTARGGEARGLEVVGIYHSHPDHPSQPSETDRARAVELWEDEASWSYVILEVAGGKVASWRSWVLSRQAFAEEPVTLAGPETGSTG